jgi:hypothetical protein
LVGALGSVQSWRLTLNPPEAEALLEPPELAAPVPPPELVPVLPPPPLPDDEHAVSAASSAAMPATVIRFVVVFTLG